MRLLGTTTPSLGGVVIIESGEAKYVGIKLTKDLFTEPDTRMASGQCRKCIDERPLRKRQPASQRSSLTASGYIRAQTPRSQ